MAFSLILKLSTVFLSLKSVRNLDQIDSLITEPTLNLGRRSSRLVAHAMPLLYLSINYQAFRWDNNFLLAKPLARIQASGGKGVNLVLDPVGGGAHAIQNGACIAMEGRWVVFGLMGGAVPEGPIFSTVLSKRLRWCFLGAFCQCTE